MKINQKLINQFKNQGFLKGKLSLIEIRQINKIKENIIKILKKDIKINEKKNINNFFENFHKHTKKKDLNYLRLKVFNQLNKNKFNISYYNILSRFIEPIVGDENVIQKKINLSIQMPGDSSSLLPVHSDTWAGDSPFEIVAWLPLVDCKKTQSMFILPKNSKKFSQFKNFVFKNNDQIYSKIKKDVKFINIKFGEVLIFSQNLPHGNVVNKEKKTRWSFNARSKSLMSPYSKKGLIDFFEIVRIKPATESGLEYEYPKFR
tara:strand:+ start:101 stop:883 length:783 start_codon:yes stop_codon:yes gene_type:complete